VRKYFDEAVEEFKDKSIDILHIDGLHTYEAVKHDYETWKGKVKDDGVILFHDIKVADFGVWQVWEELKAEHPKSTIIEFKHNAGLGVLFKDPHVSTILSPDIIEDMIEYYKLKADQHINNVKNMEELWVMKKRAGALSNENDALSKIVRELEASKLVRLDRQARRIKNLFIK
jgi:hypothetical protein